MPRPLLRRQGTMDPPGYTPSPHHAHPYHSMSPQADPALPCLGPALPHLGPARPAEGIPVLPRAVDAPDA